MMAEPADFCPEETEPGAVPSAEQVPAAFSWKDLFKALGIIWGIEIVLNVFAAMVMLAASGFQPKAMTLRIEYLLPSLVLSWIATLGVAWYFACRKYRFPILEAFAVRAIPRKTMARCLFIGIVSAVLAGVLMHFFATGEGYIVDLALNPADEEGGKPTLSPLFVLMLLMVPPLEEIYYRGFLYPALRRLAGVPVAFAAIVLWFGVIHTPQLFGDWVGVAVVTLMGVVFTFMRQHYDSILPSMISHFTYNATLALAAIVGSALE
ncbi:MAG: CPBP family intramembrane metalloprotease [Candidatus Hydrogenedentes bacterium]|nr:CPBP family intramembrane metalloprotease [Candidatus Hydrogenedentota bacterium]